MQERSCKRGMGLNRVQHPGAYSACVVGCLYELQPCVSARMPPRRNTARAATEASAVRRAGWRVESGHPVLGQRI